MSDAAKYFVDLNGKTAGPFTITEMRDLYAGRTINPATLYATEGAQEWLPVETIKPLLAAAVAAPHVQPRAVIPPPAIHVSSPGCYACGYAGRMITQTKGSFAVEVLLWILFCLPGAIYSLWRLTSGKEARCPNCGTVR
jgi:hypothetical protein